MTWLLGNQHNLTFFIHTEFHFKDQNLSIESYIHSSELAIRQSFSGQQCHISESCNV